MCQRQFRRVGHPDPSAMRDSSASGTCLRNFVHTKSVYPNSCTSSAFRIATSPARPALLLEHLADLAYGRGVLGLLVLRSQRDDSRSEEHTSELQSRGHLVCRLLLEKKKNITTSGPIIEKQINNIILLMFWTLL